MSYVYTYGLNTNSFTLGAIKIVCRARKFLKVNIRTNIHFSGVNLHYSSSSLFIWMWKFNFTI
jgi:hypothetical protein